MIHQTHTNNMKPFSDSTPLQHT